MVVAMVVETQSLSAPNLAVNTDDPSAALRARRASPVTLVRSACQVKCRDI